MIFLSTYDVSSSFIKMALFVAQPDKIGVLIIQREKLRPRAARLPA